MILSVKLFSSSFGALVEGSSAPSTPFAEYSMFLTSFVLLVPAKYALSAGRPWHAALFAIMAVSCAAYHVCDAKASTLLGPAPLCAQPLPHYLTLADHGCAYFCFVQMAFLLLGPEDHNLQWPQDSASAREPWERVPTSVAVHCRALPVGVLLLFLALYPDWHKFHFHMVFLCIAIVLNGVGQFWMSQTRREHVPKVIFHAVFWRRLVSLGLLPLCVCTTLFVFMETLEFGAGIAHAAWHIVVALLAMNVQRTIYYSLPDPLHTALSYFMQQEDPPLADIHSIPPKNPVVAHYLLSSIALTSCVTLLANAAARLLLPQTGNDWSVFGFGMLQWQCSYIIATGSLLLLAAVATTFGLIGTIDVGLEGKQDWRSHWRHVGCSLGSLSFAFGLLTMAAWLAGASPQLHASALAATVCAATVGVLLVSFSEPLVHYTASSATASTLVALRCAMAASMAVAAAGFVLSLYVLHRYGALRLATIGSPAFQNLWHGLALSQYCLLALLMVWPLTYITELRERWTPKTAQNSKWQKCLLTNSACYYETGMGTVF